MSGFDHHITIFSPKGHLYQIEYCMRAANANGNTAIAVRGKDSVAFIAQKKVPDRLLDPTSVTSLFRVSDNVGVLLLGLSPDVQSRLDRIRYEAQQFWFENGFEMSAQLLATRIADLCQVGTQEASGRALAVFALFIGVDEERGPVVYKVDPAGSVLPLRGGAMGKYEPEALSFLEKRVDTLSSLDSDATVQMALQAMQHVLGADFKGTEVEVGLVAAGHKYSPLTEAQIESHLNAIADRADN